MGQDRTRGIRLLVLDVDGVLTDGRILLTDRGEEAKAFHVKDGLGLRMLMERGVQVALVSGRRSAAVEKRAGELGIREVHQGVSDKQALCRALRERGGLEREEVACIGDDLPDLGMFAEAGLRIAVADAAPELRRAADRVTAAPGGCGAVREACEWLLASRG